MVMKTKRAEELSCKQADILPFTSNQEQISLSFMLLMLASSSNSSIMQSIRFIRDLTRLVSEVGDSS